MSNTDVLIVGAGPTGLMLACQLLRFGVAFKIIDKNQDRSQESRAFGIQARSMEIFQNLGIEDEFLKRAGIAHLVHFYLNGAPLWELNFDLLGLPATPFPHIFFLPQWETEKILIDYIEQHGKKIERETVLKNFNQNAERVEATIQNLATQEEQSITCAYIVGCDGAHSTVREVLNIPFEGDAYQQDFFLADATVTWDKSMRPSFMVFFDSTGLFLHIPLTPQLSRIIGVDALGAKKTEKKSIERQEIESLARRITHQSIAIENPVWMTRFHLHHRVVNRYQKGRAFLAGDAAHIHSPVGAQGMNTGLQDATNLAWKIAGVLKANMSERLLATYSTERQWVGKNLTQTTDRFFSLLTTRNIVIKKLRPLILLIIFKCLKHIPKLQKEVFWLMSQLGVHYPRNYFLEGPKAGQRAKDAPVALSTLFTLFKQSPFTLLIFLKRKENRVMNESKLIFIEKSFGRWIKIYKFMNTDENKTLFERYEIAHSGGIFFIRPDGYIAFHQNNTDLKPLIHYLKKYHFVL